MCLICCKCIKYIFRLYHGSKSLYNIKNRWRYLIYLWQFSCYNDPEGRLFALTIKQIHYFIAVAETKSFTNAARNYFIAQTAMSQQISALEKELGFLLFHRSNRSVELTQAGQALYEKVRPLVLDLERAVESASSVAGVQSTIFRIGLFDQAINRFLAPALKEFSQSEPEVTPLLISDNQIMLLESLQGRTIDAMLLGKRYYQRRASLEAVELFSYQVLDYILAVPAAHPLAQQQHIHWEDLQGLTLIAYSPFKEDQQAASLQATLRDHKVDAHILLSTRDVPTALLYVEAEMGCCLLPARAAVHKNQQVAMLSIEEDLRDTMLLLSHRDNDSHLLSRFTAICRKTLEGN